MYDKRRIKADFEKAAPCYNDYADLQRVVATRLMGKMQQGLPVANVSPLIMDIGAGTGFIAQQVEWNMVQVDLAYKMCDIASAYAPVVNADMEQLPFADNICDGVISSLALQWATDPRAMLAQAYRVCKKGGRVVISTFGPDTLKELKQLMLILGGSEHVSAFLPASTLQMLAEKQGFVVCECETEIMRRSYCDIRALYASIKGVGGNNKREDRASFLSKSVFKELESAYHTAYNDPQGIRASWDIIYLVLEV